MANFSDLARKINEENQKSGVIVQEAQPFKSTLDTSETDEFIEKARQSLIGEKDASNKGNIAGTAKTQTSSSAYGQRTANGQTQQSGTAQSAYRSPYVGGTVYPGTKAEDIDTKAKKYSQKCIQVSIDVEQSSKNNWDIVSVINESYADKKKSAEQRAKDKKKKRDKESTAQLFLELGCITIESFYRMLGGKKIE